MSVRSIHSVSREQFQNTWDNSVPPILTARPGEAITITTRESSNLQLTPQSQVDAIAGLDFSQVNPVHGPIAVEGAAPGDVVQVDIHSIDIIDWGWTANIPGFGLLADEYTDPFLHVWNFDRDKGVAQFRPGVEIPIDPFIGVIGLAPAAPGQHSTVPPTRVGGNMDTRFMRSGTTLYLPVEVEGGLFSLGDVHAAQGDGEVCGTAIETAGEVTLTFTLHKDRPLASPAYAVDGALVRTGTERGYYATTGIGPDLFEATRDSVRNMITYLQETRGLSAVEAYALCSVAADLKISEVVDFPNWVVSFFLPNSIFTP
jgi:acetamidase/formamidase